MTQHVFHVHLLEQWHRETPAEERRRYVVQRHLADLRAERRTRRLAPVRAVWAALAGVGHGTARRPEAGEALR